MWTQNIELNEALKGEISSSESHVQNLPLAVNWHFWPRCNYGCTFCFARFEEIKLSDRLAKEDALKIPQLLSSAGADKITFVGGEPTLCPYLGELLHASKDANLTTCIVSNGTGLTEEFLEKHHHLIDWIGISIDASNDKLHYSIGRGVKRDLENGFSNHLKDTISIWKRCQNYGIKMKLNTVVSSVNIHDDMTELVLDLKPQRWKIFQVLPVDGQNDGDVDDLLITEEAFNEWLSRHEKVASQGIQFVPESNDLMRGSYAMMDALGRFYSNVEGGHSYGPSVLDVGVKEAWSQNCFLEDKFNERGGVYEWKVKKLPMASNIEVVN